MPRFADCFFGNEANPYEGLSKLHSLILRDLVEAEELLFLFKQRIGVELLYSQKLLEIKQYQLSENGFKADENRLSSIVFLKYKTEMATLANSHKNIANHLTRLVTPIERFIDICKKELSPRAESLHLGWKKYLKLLEETKELEEKASTRWESYSAYSNADRVNRLQQEVDEALEGINMIEIGSRKIPAEDFNTILAHMQNKIPCEDLWKLLGTYKDCYNGELMLSFLKRSMPESDARELLEYLCMYGYLKPVSYTGILNQFTTTAEYQWKIYSAEFSDDSGDKKLKLQAARAALEYGRAARQLESLRLSLEVLHLEYTNLAQNMMTEHIKTVKESLKNALDIETQPLAAIKTLTSRLSVFLESLNPEKDVLAVAENDKTGFKPIATFIQKSFPIDPVNFLFGVSLERLEITSKSRVSSLISKGISYLNDTFQANDQPNRYSHLDIWISQSANPNAIQSLRSVLNSSPTVTRRILRKFPPEIIVGVIKLYLLELPISLCYDDLYEPLKILYLSKADDSMDNRLASVRNLLATMPSTHFYTLASLVQYWSNLISHLEPNDPKVSELAATLGPYVLRPKKESRVTINDKHPSRLARDMVLYSTEIIHPEVLTPSGPSSASLDKVAVESEDEGNEDDYSNNDDAASLRVLWDQQERERHSKAQADNAFIASIASSFRSHFTKKTGYSLTIHEQDAERRSLAGPPSASTGINDLELVALANNSSEAGSIPSMASNQNEGREAGTRRSVASNYMSGFNTEGSS